MPTILQAKGTTKNPRGIMRIEKLKKHPVHPSFRFFINPTYPFPRFSFNHIHTEHFLSFPHSKILSVSKPTKFVLAEMDEEQV